MEQVQYFTAGWLVMGFFYRQLLFFWILNWLADANPTLTVGETKTTYVCISRWYAHTCVRVHTHRVFIQIHIHPHCWFTHFLMVGNPLCSFKTIGRSYLIGWKEFLRAQAIIGRIGGLGFSSTGTDAPSGVERSSGHSCHFPLSFRCSLSDTCMCFSRPGMGLPSRTTASTPSLI